MGPIRFYSNFWKSKECKALVLVVFLLLSVEIMLQARSQILYGQSIFNVVQGQKTYQYNERLGLNLLRPNSSIEGARAKIVTNSLGLRSPEIPRRPAIGEIRIAVVGASSVMGAYAKKNDDTFPYLLGKVLTEKFPGHKISIMNAGVAGYTISDELQMIKHVVIPHSPDLVILYSGQNNVACEKVNPQSQSQFSPHPLVHVNVPSWFLSYELLTKNTVGLRTTAIDSSSQAQEPPVSFGNFTEKLKEIVTVTRGRHVQLLLMTNAMSFRRNMPIHEQLRLSETARYYKPCMNVEGLLDAGDRLNSEIKNMADSLSVPLLDLAYMLPGGDKFFQDASHFSLVGEHFVAEALMEIIIERHLLPKLNQES